MCCVVVIFGSACFVFVWSMTMNINAEAICQWGHSSPDSFLGPRDSEGVPIPPQATSLNYSVDGFENDVPKLKNTFDVSIQTLLSNVRNEVATTTIIFLLVLLPLLQALLLLHR